MTDILIILAAIYILYCMFGYETKKIKEPKKVKESKQEKWSRRLEMFQTIQNKCGNGTEEYIRFQDLINHAKEKLNDT